MAKKWYLSRSLWIAIVGFIATVAEAILVNPEISTRIIASQDSILFIIAWIVRWRTNQELTK